MKHQIALPLVAAMLAAPSFAKGTKHKANETDTKATVLKTAHDSASYALGINVGASIKGQISSLPGTPINTDLFIAAMQQYFKETDTTKLAIKPTESDKILNTYLMHEQEKEQKAAVARNQAWLDKNAQEPGVITTGTGLQFMILKDGNGVKPGPESAVKVNYKGTLTDGSVFDQSPEGQPIELTLNGVIRGWTEGLQLMNVGAKYRFFIKPELAYGNRPMRGIPANSILVFDVELVAVGAAQPKPQRQAPTSKYQFEELKY